MVVLTRRVMLWLRFTGSCGARPYGALNPVWRGGLSYPPLADIVRSMEFIETPTFTRLLTELLTDDDYTALQNVLVVNPERGDIIKQNDGEPASFSDRSRRRIARPTGRDFVENGSRHHKPRTGHPQQFQEAGS